MAKNSFAIAAAVLYLSILNGQATKHHDTKTTKPRSSEVASARKEELAGIRKGIASWYGVESSNRTASGSVFDHRGFTCASWDYPFGTRLAVYYCDRRGWGRRVVVTVTDRGPAKRLHRIIDLSEASFAALAPKTLGLIPVTIEVVK